MCGPAVVPIVAGLSGTAAGGYGAYEARQQRKDAERAADAQAADLAKEKAAQEALLASRQANKKYQGQATLEIGGSTNNDGTTGVDGMDAFRIKPTGSALNVPGGQA